jgi:WD40 repeat protein
MILTPVIASGGQLHRALRNTLTGHTGTVSTVACTLLDGRPVAVTGSDDFTVRVWDLATGQPGPTLIGHSDTVAAVACTLLDGRPVAVTGSDDFTVRVWDLATGQPGPTLIGHSDTVAAVACTLLDGRPAAVTASRDHTVRVWDLATGICMDQWPMWDNVNALAVTPTHLIAAAGWDIATFVFGEMPQ